MGRSAHYFNMEAKQKRATFNVFHLQNITLEFWIDGTPLLLIIPIFATLLNLIQHSLFISFGEFCQLPLLFQTPRLLINSWAQSAAVASSLGKATKLMCMSFL